MALAEEFIRTGNFFFRYRSFLPLVLFPFSLIVLRFDGSNVITDSSTLLPPAFAVSAIGLMIRFLVIGYVPRSTSGRNRERQVADSINTKGMYSLVRNPLYLGNYLMWLGLLIYLGHIWFTITVSLLFWLYYERIIFTEEKFLKEKFQQEYHAWASKTPAFFPRLWGWNSSGNYFSWKNILKREYSGFLALSGTFFFINLAKNYILHSILHVDKLFWILLITALVVSYTLKILKKRGYLEVQGR